MGLFNLFEDLFIDIATEIELAPIKRETRKLQREIERDINEMENRRSSSSAVTKNVEYDRRQKEETLKLYISQYGNEAIIMEDKCIDIVYKKINDSKKAIQDHWVYKKGILKRPQIDKSDIECEVIDKIRLPIEKKLSLTNARCSKIMELSYKIERDNQMQNFVNAIQIESVQNVAKHMKKFYSTILNEWKEDLSDVLVEQCEQLFQMENEEKNICKSSKKKKDKFENSYVQASLVVLEIEKILDIIT